MNKKPAAPPKTNPLATATPTVPKAFAPVVPPKAVRTMVAASATIKPLPLTPEQKTRVQTLKLMLELCETELAKLLGPNWRAL